MIDPRFQEVLEFIDEVDADDRPTKRAMIALKIEEYAQDVDEQRNDLITIEDELSELKSVVATLEVALEEQANLKADLVTEMKAIKHYYDNGVDARIGIEK